MEVKEFYEVLKLIMANYSDADSGIFSSRNTANDKMHTLYKSDNVTLEICKGFGYFEVFCDEEYFEKFKDFYYSLDELINPYDNCPVCGQCIK